MGSAAAVSVAVPASSSTIRLTDITRMAGITFAHTKGASGRHYYPEQFGAGVALLDYNKDGLLDVFFVQGAPLPGTTGSPPSGDVLYRNNGDGTFSDVSSQAGLTGSHYGLGVASADYDNDGYPDLFITTLEGNRLLHNDGHGRFVDVTARAGVSSPPLSTGAVFVDVDNDGWLDLFVARYTDYTIDTDLRCIDAGSVRHPVLFAQPRTTPLPPDEPTLKLAYCGPPAYEMASSRLFHNNRNGTFTDISVASGISSSKSHGLGVGVGDFNEDGRPDIFVASDMTPNLLFMNEGNSRFRQTALAAGVAVGAEGKPYAGMGVGIGDFNHDGHLDLFVTNYENEPSSLYAGTGTGLFDDRTVPSGIAALSQRFLKWGAQFVDLDLDGQLDLLIANGHVDDNLVGTPAHAPPWPASNPRAPRLMLPGREGYLQQAQVYRGTTDGRFEDVSEDAGAYFKEKHAGRGVAFGDIDNDGDWDVVIVNNDQPATLLRNDSLHRGAWARVELHGHGCNRDAIGARVAIRAGKWSATQFVPTGGSYLSEGDRRLIFAVPDATASVTAEVRWPCGAVQPVQLKPGTTTVSDGVLHTSGERTR
jgi:hypothetical protein